jgi:hypothetical protein
MFETIGLPYVYSYRESDPKQCLEIYSGSLRSELIPVWEPRNELSEDMFKMSKDPKKEICPVPFTKGTLAGAPIVPLSLGNLGSLGKRRF